MKSSPAITASSRPRSRETSSAATPRPVAGGEDHGQVSRHEGARLALAPATAAGGPPVAGEHPGGAFPDRAIMGPSGRDLDGGDGAGGLGRPSEGPGWLKEQVVDRGRAGIGEEGCEDGFTDQPRVELRTLELGGAVLVGNPPSEKIPSPYVPLVDGRAAWQFPDGSKLYIKNYPGSRAIDPRGQLHCG